MLWRVYPSEDGKKVFSALIETLRGALVIIGLSFVRLHTPGHSSTGGARTGAGAGAVARRVCGWHAYALVRPVTAASDGLTARYKRRESINPPCKTVHLRVVQEKAHIIGLGRCDYNSRPRKMKTKLDNYNWCEVS